MRAASDFSGLEPADQTRMMLFERRALVLWHHRFQLRQQGVLSDVEWHAQRSIVQDMGRRQALREAWRAFGTGFEPAFREYIDGEFKLADGT